MRVAAFSGVILLLSCVAAQAETQHWMATSTAAIAITGDVATHDDRITFAGGAMLGLRPVGGGRPGIYRVDPPAGPVLENGNRLCGDTAPGFIVLAPASGSAGLAQSPSLHLKVLLGETPPPAAAAEGMLGGGPDLCALLNYERKAGPSPAVAPARP